MNAESDRTGQRPIDESKKELAGQAGKKAVYIDRDGRPASVLIDVDEYEQLLGLYRPRVLHPSELDDAMKAELEKGFQGRATPELNHLMD